LITTDESSRLPVTFLVGIVIVLFLIGGAVLWSRYSVPVANEEDRPLPVNADDQAYFPQIHFLDPKMSRAANFLNQEVTYIFGTVENGGNRKVKQIEITLEFHDPFNQVVLRDRQRLFLPSTPPMLPGQQRDFQVPYEHISAEWNNVYPTIRVTGLILN
jgi:hypothetical protein